jgi:hypothetical protein
MIFNQFYIEHPNGLRQYFHDIKEANKAAQALVNKSGVPQLRHDVAGGASMFRPKKGSR